MEINMTLWSPTDGLLVTTATSGKGGRLENPKYFQSPGLQGFKSPACLFPHQLGELGSAHQSPLELT